MRALVLFVICGCATTQPAAPSPAPAQPRAVAGAAEPVVVTPPTAGEFVLVRGGERLFARPELDSPSITLPPAGQRFMGPIAARAIATRDGFTEIETLGIAEQFHCGRTAAYAPEVRGFVRDSSILDVTATATQARRGDLVLQVPAGIAVDRSGSELVIELAGERLAAWIDHRAIGRSYPTAPRKLAQPCLDVHAVAAFVESGAAHDVDTSPAETATRPAVSLTAFFETGERLGRVIVPDDRPPARAHQTDGQRQCFAFSIVSGVSHDAQFCVDAAELATAATLVRQRFPLVRQGRHSVDGSLDEDIIRRIVRAHLNEVRHCYKQALMQDAALRGTVTIAFSIEPDGSVPSADVTEANIADVRIGRCTAKAVERWRFPKPADGNPVRVTYPFEFGD